jgi:hypothetical protein
VSKTEYLLYRSVPVIGPNMVFGGRIKKIRKFQIGK